MHPTARPSRYELHPQLADDTAPVIELALCEVRLMDDANHPWLVLVPKALFQPDKLNVAALGNQVPQLHVHVIARYRDDIAWPRPVWGAANARPYAPEELVERVAALRAALQGRVFRQQD